jgi:hypothetical protein
MLYLSFSSTPIYFKVSREETITSPSSQHKRRIVIPRNERSKRLPLRVNVSFTARIDVSWNHERAQNNIHVESAALLSIE